MSLTLERVGKEDWAKISSAVHKYSFGIDRPPEADRIDYALVVKKDNELCCFGTVIEIDSLSAYLQHGGNFEGVKGQVTTLRGYLMLINYLRENYAFISSRVCNKNRAMLKLSWAAGFEIVGMEVAKDGSIFLNHFLNGIKSE